MIFHIKTSYVVSRHAQLTPTSQKQWIPKQLNSLAILVQKGVDRTHFLYYNSKQNFSSEPIVVGENNIHYIKICVRCSIGGRLTVIVSIRLNPVTDRKPGCLIFHNCFGCIKSFTQ